MRPATHHCTASEHSSQVRLAHASTAEPDVLRAHLETALPELITGFGYNRGYLLQILEAPPDGVRADSGAIVPDGPLWCRYRNGRLTTEIRTTLGSESSSAQASRANPSSPLVSM